MDIIAQGAEAILRRTDEGIRKERVRKRYRHPAIDTTLREQRTRMEARLIAKAARAGVPVPRTERIDESTLLLEEIQGVPLKDVLNGQPHLARIVGEIVATLHDAHIVHADLTTSNIMSIEETEQIVLIDFGLSYHTQRIEDKAVDLHVFKQSLESKHHAVFAVALGHFIEGYSGSRTAKDVLARLKQVEARGRNKKGS